MLFDPNTVAASLRFSYFDHFQTLFPVVVLMQHRNNECFQACVYYYFFCIFFLSRGLFRPFSVTLALFLSLISGSAMNVVYGEEEMKRFLEEATQVSQVISAFTLRICAREWDATIYCEIFFLLLCCHLFFSLVYPAVFSQLKLPAGRAVGCLFFLRHPGGKWTPDPFSGSYLGLKYQNKAANGVSVSSYTTKKLCRF